MFDKRGLDEIDGVGVGVFSRVVLGGVGGSMETVAWRRCASYIRVNDEGRAVGPQCWLSEGQYIAWTLFLLESYLVEYRGS